MTLNCIQQWDSSEKVYHYLFIAITSRSTLNWLYLLGSIYIFTQPLQKRQDVA